MHPTVRDLRALLAAACAIGLFSLPAARAQQPAKQLNPFAGSAEAAAEGRKLYQSYGCPGCHGLMGGGGMGKPLLDDTWIFASDDETLYKLIKGQIPEQTMPKTWAGISDEHVWKLLAYVRSLYKGDPSLVNWGTTPPPDAAERIAALAKPASASASAYTPPKGLQDMEIPTPEDNPITAGKIKLGEQLFFDKRLSKGKDMSCETCHVPEKGWADGQEFSRKFDGTLNTRHTPTLFGVAFYPELFWDGRAQGLEKAMLEVLKNQMGSEPDEVARELEQIPAYKAAFETELGGPPTGDRVAKALATFTRTIHAGDTPFDNLPEGSEDSEPAQGFKVFSEVGHCTLCHLPPLFSDTLFHNIGVGMDRPKPDRGRGRILENMVPETGEARTAALRMARTLTGAFKTASLRGLAHTAPYFHDGRAKTVEDAASVMMAGGIANRYRDEKLKAWPLTPQQRELILAFLRSLSPELKPYPRPELPQQPQAGSQ
jgi:cytochrome c peroxidase